ncbi:FecR family protein [Peristeroidobacter agariperforans]|uniref:FecR family protein n=1 Tax=Peristeroidobacter agariperforans TaxID=268404 RepID=UPI00101D2BEA|nr:FecR domain-containing protein [Peristeroidobacter agariperforans]
MNPTPEQGAVIKQAVEWHQRLKLGELDQDLRREFRVWLQSRANVEELGRLCLMDAFLEGAFKKRVRRDLPKNVVDFDSYADTVRPRPRPLQQPAVARSRFNLTRLALAGSVVLAVIATLWVSVVGTDRVISTASGSWEKQLLKDGTVVYAGPHTKLRFHFTEEMRGVALVRGQALFEVAKQPAWPFIVSTDEGTVRAVGTAFSTSDLGDSVLVTVAEGKVAVTATAVRGGVQPMVHAIANQQVVLSSTGVSTPVSVDADRELMWLRDWYEYEGERVGDIVAQLNLLNDSQVIVDDPQVLRLRVNLLSFRPSQPEEFVSKINRWYEGYPGKTSTHALRLERR